MIKNSALFSWTKTDQNTIYRRLYFCFFQCFRVADSDCICVFTSTWKYLWLSFINTSRIRNHLLWVVLVCSEEEREWSKNQCQQCLTLEKQNCTLPLLFILITRNTMLSKLWSCNPEDVVQSSWNGHITQMQSLSWSLSIQKSHQHQCHINLLLCYRKKYHTPFCIELFSLYYWCSLEMCQKLFSTSTIFHFNIMKCFRIVAGMKYI